MSLLKANAVQLGQSLTASQNFTWYQPASPDGTVRLGNGNSGSVTDLVTLTSAGNLGIGTSSPGSKLTIAGSVSGSSAANGYDAYTATRASRSFCWGLDASGNYGIWDTTSGANNRLLIDSSGNLGLGVTPSAWVSGEYALQVGAIASLTSRSVGSANRQVSLYNNAYVNSSGTLTYLISDYASFYRQNAGYHFWFTAPSGTAGNAISFTQAMTLDASGNLLVGTTSNTENGRINVSQPTNGYWGGVFKTPGAGTDGGVWIKCGDGSTGPWLIEAGTSSGTTKFRVLGNGNVQNANNSYGALSDRRLKENIVGASAKLKDLCQVRICNFNMVGDEQKQIGVIAQEVEQVFPSLVEENRDGYKSVKYSVFVPMLVKAIQELSAQVSDLKAELNELKQKVNA